MPKTKNDKPYTDKEWLREQYEDKELKQEDIADKVGVNKSCICKWMRKHNIDAIKAANIEDVDENLYEFLDGSLLGDGSYTRVSRFSGQYRITQSHREYCVWIRDMLSEYGIKDDASSIYKRKRKTGKYTYDYRTLSYVDFKEQYERWYNDQKIVPEDVRITPISIRHWYIEDGHLGEHSKNCRRISLHTNGFTKEKVNFLADRLSNELEINRDSFGIYDSHGPFLHFAKREAVMSFFAGMAPLPAPLGEAYGYKWPSEEWFEGDF